MLLGVYYDKEIPLEGGILMLQSRIDSPQCNHMTRVHDPSKLPLWIDQMVAVNRTPAVYCSPLCDSCTIGTVLEAGFKQEFNDAWMVFEGEPPSLPSIAIKNASPYHIKDYLAVFAAAFSSGVYNLGHEWKDTMREAIHAGKGQHFVALDNDRVLGVVSLFNDGAEYGIYNVGTLPHQRRKGVGAALTLYAVRAARLLGANSVFLQTELESSNEAFYQKIGFRTIFTAPCFVKPTQHTSS